MASGRPGTPVDVGDDVLRKSGCILADRFRELESPQAGRLKDIVLMATINGFEGLRHPRRVDLKQFGELFDPLFSASSEEARRQAAAALSRCAHVPSSVAFLIGSAPIAVAAAFLTGSVSLDDATLIRIIRSQGQAHATAIARRDNLSVQVVDALVERRQTSSAEGRNDASAPVLHPRMSEDLAGAVDAARLSREENLRAELKALVRAHPSAGGGEPANALHAALLVRFARSGEVNLFAASLSASLSLTLPVGESVVLDTSGQQLAIALTALGLPHEDSLFVLARLYPHLGERVAGVTRGDLLLSSVRLHDCGAFVQSWQEPDTGIGAPAVHRPVLAPDRGADPRQAGANRKERSLPAAVEAQPARSFARKR